MPLLPSLPTRDAHQIQPGSISAPEQPCLHTCLPAFLAAYLRVPFPLGAAAGKTSSQELSTTSGLVASQLPLKPRPFDLSLASSLLGGRDLTAKAFSAAAGLSEPVLALPSGRGALMLPVVRRPRATLPLFNSPPDLPEVQAQSRDAFLTTARPQ